jgi:hypothetical protein
LDRGHGRGPCIEPPPASFARFEPQQPLDRGRRHRAVPHGTPRVDLGRSRRFDVYLDDSRPHRQGDARRAGPVDPRSVPSADAPERRGVSA